MIMVQLLKYTSNRTLSVQLKYTVIIVVLALLSFTARQMHQLHFANRVSSIVDYSFESPTPKPTAPRANFGPMNVLIFYPDDMRHDSLEDARGPEVVLTPFLSKLARQGIRFTHNAVTTSICWISRATLFTGQYASQHSSNRLYCPVFTKPEYWKYTWPSMLQRLGGYFVGHIGKWQFYNSGAFKTSRFNWTQFHEGQHWYKQKGEHIHAADLSRNHAIDFLRQRPKDKPFALTVAFYPPPKPVGNDPSPGAQWSPDLEHKRMYQNFTYVPPYNFTEAFESLPPFLKRGDGPKRYKTRYSTSEHYQQGMKNYFALVTQVDRACRDIVEEVKKQQGIYNNTMIIFTTDNGLLQGAHGLAGKWNPFEESIRVPLIIYDPRMPQEKRGTLDDSFTLSVDLAETILGAANIDPAPTMQGRDISDLYLPGKNNNQKQEPWREEFYYEFSPLKEFPSSSALVRKKWKYI
jgi:arylsulfatase